MTQRETKVAIVPVQNHEPGTAHETAGGDQNLIVCSLLKLLLLLLTSRIHNHLRLKMLRRLLVHLVVPLHLLLLLRRHRRMMHYSLRGSRVRSRLWNWLLQRGTPHGWNRRTSSTATTRTHFGHRYEV